MKTEAFEKGIFNQCVAKHALISTIKPDSQSDTCSNCNTPAMGMRLDRVPDKGSGTIPSKDVFIFHGCPNCNHVSYDESDLFLFAGKKCNLKDYLLENYLV